MPPYSIAPVYLRAYDALGLATAPLFALDFNPSLLHSTQLSPQPPLVFLLARVSARALVCPYVYAYAGVQSTTLRRAEGIKVDLAIKAKDDSAASDLSGLCHVNKCVRVPIGLKGRQRVQDRL